MEHVGGICRKSVCLRACWREIPIQDFGKSSFELHLEDEQSVELRQVGTESLPSERAQLVLGIGTPGAAPVKCGMEVWFVIHCLVPVWDSQNGYRLATARGLRESEINGPFGSGVVPWKPGCPTAWR
jgi:hypothetical protein